MAEFIKKILSKGKNSIEFKNFSWLVLGKIAQMVISLVVGLLTARYLGPSNYGLINYSTTYISFFAALCTLGITAVIVKNFTDHPDEQGKTLGTALVLRLLSSLLSAVLILIIVFFVDKGEVLTFQITMLVCIGLLFQPFDIFNYWFQYKYKAKVTAIVTFVAYVAVALYRVLLLVLSKSVLWFALAQTIDYFVVAVLLVFAYKKNAGSKLSFSIKKGKQLLGTSYHFILSSLMVAVYGYTDKLMLKQMLDENSVGYYSVATTICAMWTFVLAAIIDAMYPTIMQLYKDDKEAFVKKNRQLYCIVFYVAIFVSLFVTIFADFGVRILYGDSYLPAVQPLRIVTWYTAFSYLGVARNAWLVCENKQHYLKYMYILAAVINVVLNLMLIPFLGASGAATASLITQVFTSIILPYCFKAIRPNAKMMIDAILLRGIR
jgi:O-antigen/teichoic acid export membrane protein